MQPLSPRRQLKSCDTETQDVLKAWLPRAPLVAEITLKSFAELSLKGRTRTHAVCPHGHRAQPLEDASKLVRPKGSSHLEHTTAILVFL